MREYIVGCIVVIFVAVANLGTVLREMASVLKYSNKKQVNVNKIPLYFPVNYDNAPLDSTHSGDSKGPYIPVFVCSIVTYSLAVLLLILQTMLYFIFNNSDISKIATIVCCAIMFGNQIFGLILNAIYKKKYKVPVLNNISRPKL